MALSGALKGFAKLGPGTFGRRLLGVAFGLAVISGPSLAQTGPKPAAAPPAAPDPASKVEKGRDLFANFGCGSCHTLGDAGASGHVGPSLDGNLNLTEPFIVERVTNGQGVMPSFSSQLSPDEIAAIAAYVNAVASK